jgi:SAM-dependent methyltransferase
MALTDPFDEHAERYEGWFEAHEEAYRSELDALQRFVPDDSEEGDDSAGGDSDDHDAVEIGVGTGQFAAPLGVGVGVDPSERMLRRAGERGVETLCGVAEALPFGSATFDTALVVTTICFVDDVGRALREARRVLRPDGQLVVGFIDEDSPVGRQYRAGKDDNPFYRDATFVSAGELVRELEVAGFGEFEFVQTVFDMPGELTEPNSVRDGYGEGVFVVVRARP